MVSALMIDLRSFSDFAECHLSENDLIAYLIMIKSTKTMTSRRQLSKSCEEDV